MLKIGVLGAYRGKCMIDVLMVYKDEAKLVAICDKFQPALDKVKNRLRKRDMKVFRTIMTLKNF